MLPEGGRVGELDEEMVYESRVGDVFILGASTWRITDIGPDRVEVIPAPGEPAARMPYWHGDALGRSIETGRAVGAFIRDIGSLDEASQQHSVWRINIVSTRSRPRISSSTSMRNGLRRVFFRPIRHWSCNVSVTRSAIGELSFSHPWEPGSTPHGRWRSPRNCGSGTERTWM